jgi:hypothetical protein
MLSTLAFIQLITSETISLALRVLELQLGDRVGAVAARVTTFL